MIPTETRTAYGEYHAQFRDQVRRFFAKELAPNLERWEREGIVDRAFWRACGEAGFSAPTCPAHMAASGLISGLTP